MSRGWPGGRRAETSGSWAGLSQIQLTSRGEGAGQHPQEEDLSQRAMDMSLQTPVPHTSRLPLPETWALALFQPSIQREAVDPCHLPFLGVCQQPQSPGPPRGPMDQLLLRVYLQEAAGPDDVCHKLAPGTALGTNYPRDSVTSWSGARVPSLCKELRQLRVPSGLQPPHLLRAASEVAPDTQLPSPPEGLGLLQSPTSRPGTAEGGSAPGTCSLSFLR